MRISNRLPRLCLGEVKGRTVRVSGLLGGAALFWGLGAVGAWALPAIFNQPFTANPGDVISVTGSSLTTAPKVYIQGSRQSAATLVPAMEAADNVVIVQIPATMAFDMYKLWVVNGNGTSAPVYLNAPRAMHFDAPRAMHYDAAANANVDNAATPAVEIAGSDSFRMFGRNLYVNGAAPKVTLIDAQSGASLTAAVNTASSDAYSLTLTAPSGVVAGRTYNVTVSNGYGSANADQAIIGRAGGGTDYWQLGATWGREFINYQNGVYNPATPGVNEQNHHVYNVMTDPALKLHAVGNGVADDTAAINGAIAAAAKSGGGIAYLPAGTYRLASPSGAQTGIALQAGVVLNGHSSADTKIVYGPTGPQPSSYNFTAVSFNGNVSGIDDLSFENTDKTGLNITPLVNQWLSPLNKLFVQRVVWNLGGGPQIMLKDCDKVTILNSTFKTLANGPNTIGPFYIVDTTNMTVRSNSLSYGFQGSVSFANANNLILEYNHFTRYSSPTWTGLGRHLSLTFIQGGVVQNNTFDVSGGALPFHNSDGETILSEGGAQSPSNDSGTVTAATSASITDSSRCATCWNSLSNSYVVMASGKGAGQWRHIVKRSGDTFSIDRPWDVTPAAGDHFSTALPSYENVIIRNNTLQNNPAGIVLYGPSMFLNVAITGNTLTDNGGIVVAPYQVNQARWTTSPPVAYLFATYRNIEIKNNVLTNTKGQWGSYINVEGFLVSPNQFWGASVDGVEVRNNKITAHTATNAQNYTYTGATSGEGYQNEVLFQPTSGSFTDNGMNAVVGTVFQGNLCTNCALDYRVSHGVLATVIWNATDSSNVASTFLTDQVFGNYSANSPGARSTGTLTNNSSTSAAAATPSASVARK
jgi:hypothetical protein